MESVDEDFVLVHERILGADVLQLHRTDGGANAKYKHKTYNLFHFKELQSVSQSERIQYFNDKSTKDDLRWFLFFFYTAAKLSSPHKIVSSFWVASSSSGF